MVTPVIMTCLYVSSISLPGQTSENQETQDAQDDGERHEETGYPVEEPERSPETHDGHGGPYGGYAVRVKPAEHDDCRDGQCGCPCPPVGGYLPDSFFHFHNLHVLRECHSRFRGIPADRFHGQGFREKYRSLSGRG